MGSRAERSVPDRALLEWPIQDSPPPDSISCWVSVSNPKAGQGSSSGGFGIGLHAFEFQGKSFAHWFRKCGLGGPIGTLNFQLVYHPGCSVDHPFEDSGGMVRLWPNPDAIQLNQLRPLTADQLAQWHEVWGLVNSVVLEPGFNPFSTPWVCEQGFDPWNVPTGVSCVSGGTQAL